MGKAFARTTTNRLSDTYAATKSQNEIYYQMASIFKQVVKREDKQANKILSRLLSTSMSQNSLEN